MSRTWHVVFTDGPLAEEDYEFLVQPAPPLELYYAPFTTLKDGEALWVRVGDDNRRHAVRWDGEVLYVIDETRTQSANDVIDGFLQAFYRQPTDEERARMEAAAAPP